MQSLRAGIHDLSSRAAGAVVLRPFEQAAERGAARFVLEGTGSLSTRNLVAANQAAESALAVSGAADRIMSAARAVDGIGDHSGTRTITLAATDDAMRGVMAVHSYRQASPTPSQALIWKSAIDGGALDYDLAGTAGITMLDTRDVVIAPMHARSIISGEVNPNAVADVYSGTATLVHELFHSVARHDAEQSARMLPFIEGVAETFTMAELPAAIARGGGQVPSIDDYVRITSHAPEYADFTLSISQLAEWAGVNMHNASERRAFFSSLASTPPSEAFANLGKSIAAQHGVTQGEVTDVFRYIDRPFTLRDRGRTMGLTATNDSASWLKELYAGAPS